MSLLECFWWAGSSGSSLQKCGGAGGRHVPTWRYNECSNTGLRPVGWYPDDHRRDKICVMCFCRLFSENLTWFSFPQLDTDLTDLWSDRLPSRHKELRRAWRIQKRWSVYDSAHRGTTIIIIIIINSKQSGWVTDSCVNDKTTSDPTQPTVRDDLLLWHLNTADSFQVRHVLMMMETQQQSEWSQLLHCDGTDMFVSVKLPMSASNTTPLQPDSLNKCSDFKNCWVKTNFLT